MEITEEQVKHLAELSNFSLKETEIAGLQEELGGILKYVSQLDDLDTKDVLPTYQTIEMENIWREDEILKQDASREELLALTVEEKDNQIKVPKVL